MFSLIGLRWWRDGTSLLTTKTVLLWNLRQAVENNAVILLECYRKWCLVLFSYDIIKESLRSGFMICLWINQSKMLSFSSHFELYFELELLLLADTGKHLYVHSVDIQLLLEPSGDARPFKFCLLSHLSSLLPAPWERPPWCMPWYNFWPSSLKHTRSVFKGKIVTLIKNRCLISQNMY